MLHLLASGNEAGATDQIAAIKASQHLFKLASTPNKFSGWDRAYTFQLPVLPDMYGRTPLDDCLEIVLKPDPLGHFVPKPDSKDDKTDSLNLAMAEAIFDGIRGYALMHSSFFITESVIEATRLGNHAVRGYFESTFSKTKHIFTSTTQKGIRDDQIRTSPAMGEYASMYVPVNVEASAIEKTLLDESKPLSPLELRLLDLPFIIDQTHEGYAFIYALRESPDLDIFDCSSIQILIDGHFDHWRKVSLYFVGLPMVWQLLIFTIWSNIVLPNVETDGEKLSGLGSFARVSLAITGLYLILIEVTAAARSGREYFKDTSRVFNVIPSLTILL